MAFIEPMNRNEPNISYLLTDMVSGRFGLWPLLPKVIMATLLTHWANAYLHL